MAKRPDDGELNRDDVAGLLADGCRWEVSYCQGAGTPAISGSGVSARLDVVLPFVPTAAELA